MMDVRSPVLSERGNRDFGPTLLQIVAVDWLPNMLIAAAYLGWLQTVLKISANDVIFKRKLDVCQRLRRLFTASFACLARLLYTRFVGHAARLSHRQTPLCDMLQAGLQFAAAHMGMHTVRDLPDAANACKDHSHGWKHQHQHAK